MQSGDQGLVGRFGVRGQDAMAEGKVDNHQGDIEFKVGALGDHL
jgi:hypothetical protein